MPRTEETPTTVETPGTEEMSTSCQEHHIQANVAGMLATEGMPATVDIPRTS